MYAVRVGALWSVSAYALTLRGCRRHQPCPVARHALSTVSEPSTHSATPHSSAHRQHQRQRRDTLDHTEAEVVRVPLASIAVSNDEAVDEVRNALKVARKPMATPLRVLTEMGAFPVIQALPNAAATTVQRVFTHGRRTAAVRSQPLRAYLFGVESVGMCGVKPACKHTYVHTHV